MKKQKTEETKKTNLPDLKDLKVGKDGYKNVSTVYDSQFLKFENVGDVFTGKYMETIDAGKKGEEKPCALFQEKKTGKSFLIGNSLIMTAVGKYGDMEYRITYRGKTKGKKFTYSNFDIEVK